jgi:hypothetical protein
MAIAVAVVVAVAAAFVVSDCALSVRAVRSVDYSSSRSSSSSGVSLCWQDDVTFILKEIVFGCFSLT